MENVDAAKQIHILRAKRAHYDYHSNRALWTYVHKAEIT